MTEDEIMSPTLEASIVLWALEKIDPRLPKKIKKNYGHQMVGNTCIVALQPLKSNAIGCKLEKDSPGKQEGYQEEAGMHLQGSEEAVLEAMQWVQGNLSAEFVTTLVAPNQYTSRTQSLLARG